MILTIKLTKRICNKELHFKIVKALLGGSKEYQIVSRGYFLILLVEDILGQY